jgi:hypothetical protein
MPTPEHIWLNYIKGLFPKLRKVGKKHQAKSFRIGQLKSLDLSIENDQLLAQQRIFYNRSTWLRTMPKRMPMFRTEIAGFVLFCPLFEVLL